MFLEMLRAQNLAAADNAEAETTDDVVDVTADAPFRVRLPSTHSATGEATGTPTPAADQPETPVAPSSVAVETPGPVDSKAAAKAAKAAKASITRRVWAMQRGQLHVLIGAFIAASINGSLFPVSHSHK